MNFSECHSDSGMQHRHFRCLLSKSSKVCIIAMHTLTNYSSPFAHPWSTEHTCKRLWRVHMTTTSLSIPGKCKLGVTQLEFLGHYVDHNGIRPLEDKALQTQYKLSEFLRLVNFYRQSILHRVDIWNETTKTAFNATKEALAKLRFSRPILEVPTQWEQSSNNSMEKTESPA